MSSSNEPRDAAARDAARASALAETLQVRERPAQSSPAAPGPLAEGELLAGKYRLIQPLGRGGMAEVWRAEHVPLRRDVAVKVVLAETLTNPRVAAVVLARFQFEAQVSAQLCEKSKHIVAVYDFGTHRGVPFLVMELVTGGSLEREIEVRGKLPPEELAGILEQAADGLDTAHALGVVHRDLKPSNILLARGKGGAITVKIADFGVAKAVTGELRVDQPRATDAGVLVGSPAFMSPEQINGNHAVDARSDVWSMAIVAYEALTGGECFRGDTLVQVLAAVTARRYVRLSERVPGLPRALDGWLERSLAAEPEERFGSVGELAATFRASLSARSGDRSRRRSIALGAAVILLAASALIGARFLDSGDGGAESGGAPGGGTGAASAPAPPPSSAASSAAIAPPPAPTSTEGSSLPSPPPPSTAPSPPPSTEPSTAPPVSSPPPSSTTTRRPPRKIDRSEIQ